RHAKVTVRRIRRDAPLIPKKQMDISPRDRVAKWPIRQQAVEQRRCRASRQPHGKWARGAHATRRHIGKPRGRVQAQGLFILKKNQRALGRTVEHRYSSGRRVLGIGCWVLGKAFLSVPTPNTQHLTPSSVIAFIIPPSGGWEGTLE